MHVECHNEAYIGLKEWISLSSYVPTLLFSLSLFEASIYEILQYICTGKKSFCIYCCGLNFDGTPAWKQ